MTVPRYIFQSILWGQATEIIPRQVDICAPLQFHTYNTNYGGPLRKSAVIKSGAGPSGPTSRKKST